MAVYNVIYGSLADRSGNSATTTYAAARESVSATIAGQTSVRVAQNFNGSAYTVSQLFPVFDTSSISSFSGASGFLSFSVEITPTTVADILELRAASAITNLIKGSLLAAETPLYGSWTVVGSTGRRTITLDFSGGMASSATCSLVLHSQNQRLNVAPSGAFEGPVIYCADQTGTTNDPFLSINLATAWAFLGVSNEVAVATTAHALVTTGISGTLAAGDLLVACITSRIASTTSVTLPTGGEWTLVSEQKNNNVLTTSSALPSGLMAYCVRGASNPNLTFTHPVAPSQAQGRIVAYRNVDTSSPKDTQTSFTTATAQTAVTGTGLTTTQIEDLIVAMACGGQEAAWSAFNATDPAGASGATVTTAPTTTWSERADSLVTTGADGSLAIFDAVKLTAGATGNLTATASVSAGHVVIAGAFKIAPPAVTGYELDVTVGAITLAGSTATLRAGRALVTGVGAIAVTGIDAGGAKGTKLAATTGAVTLAGQAVNLKRSYSLIATKGSVVVTFNDANLIATVPAKLTAGVGAVVLAGQAATLRQASSYRISAATGTFWLSALGVDDAWDAGLWDAAEWDKFGIDVILRVGRVLPAAKGAVTLSGSPANLKYNHVLTAGVGTINLIGRDTNWLKGYRTTASVGSVTLAGSTAVLRTGRKLVTATYSAAVSGKTAILKYGHMLTAGSGAITLTGYDVNLRYQRGLTLIAGTGAVVVSGKDVNLIATSAKVLTAGVGAISVAPKTAILRYGHVLTAQKGAVALTGVPANLIHRRAYFLSPTVGAVVLSGSPATLTYRRAYSFTAGLGAITVSMKSAILQPARRMSPAKGSVVVSGIDANLKLRAVYNLITAPGGIVVTGNPVVLSTASSKVLGAQTGAITLSGKTAALKYNRVMPVAKGAITLTGYPVNLNHYVLQHYRLEAAPTAVVIASRYAELQRGNIQPGPLRFGVRAVIPGRW